MSVIDIPDRHTQNVDRRSAGQVERKNDHRHDGNPHAEHKANIKWARNDADFGYKNYSRDHIWRFDEVPASAAPAYLGNPQRVDPEAAFVAALSSCHMLTFLALASNRGSLSTATKTTPSGALKATRDTSGGHTALLADMFSLYSKFQW